MNTIQETHEQAAAVHLILAIDSLDLGYDDLLRANRHREAMIVDHILAALRKIVRKLKQPV